MYYNNYKSIDFVLEILKTKKDSVVRCSFPNKNIYLFHIHIEMYYGFTDFGII